MFTSELVATQVKEFIMPRVRRQIAESGIYHITSRGSGKRILFEDDYDRRFYLRKLRENLSNSPIKLLAWCLMDNHVHLLAEGQINDISRLMHRQNSSFATYFNKKNDHVGHVFQSRFASFPVENETYLLVAVRYIHLNPLELGYKDPANYAWSSYKQYLGESGICDIRRVQSCFDRESDFVDFHAKLIKEARKFSAEKDPFIQEMGLLGSPRLTDDEARAVAQSLCEGSIDKWINSLALPLRNDAINRLCDFGLSYRQIQRLTGIGLSSIKRARRSSKREKKKCEINLEDTRKNAEIKKSRVVRGQRRTNSRRIRRHIAGGSN